jgi:hypothetical protein
MAAYNESVNKEPHDIFITNIPVMDQDDSKVSEAALHSKIKAILKNKYGEFDISLRRQPRGTTTQ